MRSLSLAVVLVALASISPAASLAAVEKPGRGDSIEDRPEPLAVQRRRSEADEDRLEAAAKFAAGRTLEQREHFAPALRLYERAFRLDPHATLVLREIVPLAYSLNHRSEALRYAIKLAEQDDSDPALVRRIGLFLAETGEPKRGAVLLEKALKLESAAEKPTAAQTEIRLELGRADFLLERYADAARLFDKVLPALEMPKDFGLTAEERRKLIGDDGVTYELIGATFLEVNRPDDAAAAFHKRNDIAPNQAELTLNLARVENKSSHPAEALSKLDAYFAAKPANLSLASLELLKAVLGHFNQPGQLVERLEKLHEAQADSPTLNYFLAEQYRTAGALAQSKPLYEAVLKKGPTAEAYRALIEVNLKLGDHDGLIELLGDVVEKSGSFEVIAKELKAITADDKLVGSLYQVARDKHGKATAADAAALLGAASLAAERKEWDRAEEFYNLALKAKSADAGETLLSWGLSLFLAEKNAAAAAVFRRGIDEGKLPDDKPAFEFYLAGALEADGKTDEALAVLDQMVAKKKPKEARYFARRPWILFHAKRNDEARKAYQELIARFGDDFTSDENRDTLREAREALSAVCVTQHDLTAAEELLQQVLDEFPDDVGARNDLGYLWADEGKHLERALGMVQAAVAAEPKNTAYRDSLGWALFRVGKTDEAIAELKKAAAGETPDATILEHLGDVYKQIHKRQEAQDNWKRALEGYEKEKDVEKAKLVREKLAGLKADENSIH